MENYKAGGEKGNSNLFATNRLFKKSPLFRKRKKKAPGVYDPKAKYRFDKGGVTRTKLSDKEEQAFQKFYNTLPDNLMQDDPEYDIRGYWDSEGRPEEFNYNQPKEDDGYYHAYSINSNTGEYLKAPTHPTFQHAVDEDRKIGFRPVTNVQGRNIAIENESIIEPEAQSFLRNMTGPVSYKAGGALLTKKVTCKKCSWTWDAADGGSDMTKCHKCGGQGLVHAKNGGLNKFVEGGPTDCGEGYKWNEELQECVEDTSKYNEKSYAKHLAEKKIYEDALKEIEVGTTEYAILEEAYNAKVKKLEKEKARVLKVRGNVIPASKALDKADDLINFSNPFYQDYMNAENPKELALARKALPQEIKNVLPNQGLYNVAKWNSKTNKWNEGLNPGRELYCTPYGCFAYQKAGASDVPTIGGNIDFANRAATGDFAFEKINPNERQPGDMALMVEMAPNDYSDPNSGESRRPHHTTIYAEPDPKFPKDTKKGNFYNANSGSRLNFEKTEFDMNGEPGDRFDYYRYVGAQNKINNEVLDLAKQKEEFNIKQEQRKNNVALPSIPTLKPNLITQNNTATLQYPKKEEKLKNKRKLFKNKSFKYGGLNKHEDEGMILDLSLEEIKQYTEGGYVIEDISVPSLSHMDNGGEPCEQGFDRDPITGECVSIMGQTERVQRIEEVPTNQYSPYIAAYEEAHPRDEFVYKKKADYLKRNKNWNRQAGLSQDNFNTDVEGNFNRNWEYDRNSAVIEQFAKDHGINPKNHVEIVEKMADKGNVSRDMIAHSKYGSKLQPTMWARSLAGAQELANFLVKASTSYIPGVLDKEAPDVFNKEIKGLTKKENKEIHESRLGALESLAWMDHPGLIIGNALSGASLASGSGYGDKDKPGFFSGEFTSDMDPLKAALLNPALYADLGLGMVGPARAGLRAAPLLTKVDDVMDVVNIAKNADKVTDEVKLVANAKRSQQLDGEAFSIYKGNKNVGEISGTRSSNGDFVVSDIGVDAPFQKQGIGTQAYKQLNQSLAPGNKVKSWGAFVEDAGIAPGRNTWQGLEKQGLAKVNEKGIYEMLPEVTSAPKSEINWAAWNSKTAEQKDLMNAYAEIERGTKAKGNWMKNADGTPFQGTPEQFVQQKSSWFKKSFPDYYGETLTTRSPNKFDIFDESKFGATDEGWYGKGIYTYPTQEAKQKGLGTMYGSNEYDLYVNSANKGFVDEPLEAAAEMYQKNTDQLFNDLKAYNEDYIKKYGSNELTERLVKESYDDLLQRIKAAEENNINQYTTLTVPSSANETVIPFSNRVKSAKGNIGYFDLKNPIIYEKNGGSIEMDLTREQINEYKKGGWIVEELDNYAEGGEPCPQGFQEDPVTGDCVVITERTQDIQEVPINQYSKYITEYEEANPRDAYVYQKKAEYLNKHKGLNRMAGLSQDNFPEKVESNYNKNWEYDKNSAVIEKFAKEHGINPNNHAELVEKLADKGAVSYDMAANSKYGSKLQPSLWARSLAGAQELGNFVVKQLPGEQGDVFNYQTPGLTKKEWEDIHDSNFGALQTFSAIDIPGAVIGNSIADLSTASGGNYQESPGLLSGELKSNMDPLKATLLNPFNYSALAKGLFGVQQGIQKLGRILAKEKSLPGSPNAVDFSKYLTQEEAVAARGQRLISQKNKPGWNEQLTPDLETRLNNAVKNHNPASDYPGELLGTNTMGRTATEVSKNAISKQGIPLNDANKARVAGHETGHYYSNSPEEGAEWASHFDFSKLIHKTRTYLRGKGRLYNYSNEIRERAAQLKDYIAQKNGIPLNQDFKITQVQLDDAIKNYVKDTGLDNTMSKMLGALKNKKGFLKTMNKYALGTAPYVVPAAIIGSSQIPQNKYGGLNKFIESGVIENNMSKLEIKKLIAQGYVIEEI